MTEQIEALLENECGLVKDRLIIVGVSGGPDSLCLMDVLRQAGYPLIVAYFDHQLRPDAARDARMVEKTAARLMITPVVDGADVKKYSEEHKLTIEEAARELRYRFLFDLARHRNAQAVAVGHTADDQVETVLMHFLRGSGLAGLKGMSYRSIIQSFDPEIPVVRPLLDLWREDTEIYCAVHGLRPHYDSTNDLLNFQRNRIRHLLIPTLETYNPKFRETVFRMSQSLKGDFSFMLETMEKAWGETVSDEREDLIAMDADLLAGLPLGLQRNLIRHAMQTLSPGVDVTFTALERAITVVTSPHAAHADLKGGMRIHREGGHVYICTADASIPVDFGPQLPAGFSLNISVPGQVTLPDGWKLSCERWHLASLAREQAEGNQDQFQVWLDADELPDVFTLRTRRPGDHFSPLGMDGHSQKVSDFFVNEKLPQRARDGWTLLCAGDEVIWVPGYRPSHRHRMKDSTKGILYFSMTRPQG